MSEREIYVRPPEVDEAPGIESVELIRLSPALASATGGEPFEIHQNRFSQGERSVSLEEARRLGRAWGCYPVPGNGEAVDVSSYAPAPPSPVVEVRTVSEAASPAPVAIGWIAGAVIGLGLGLGIGALVRRRAKTV